MRRACSAAAACESDERPANGAAVSVTNDVASVTSDVAAANVIVSVVANAIVNVDVAIDLDHHLRFARNHAPQDNRERHDPVDGS